MCALKYTYAIIACRGAGCYRHQYLRLGAYECGRRARGRFAIGLKERSPALIGNALFNEYESLLKRDNLWKDSLLKRSERERFFDALLSVSAWTPIYYLWRPNLRDESDNHLIELAVAAGAETIITANKRDFAGSELLFPQIRIETAGEFLDQRKTIWAH